MLKKIVAILLLPALLCGCAMQPAKDAAPAKPAVEPSASAPAVQDAPTEAPEPQPDLTSANAPLSHDFDYALLREALAAKETNTVISPISAYLCLALMMNGANGGTLKEAEAVMGGTLEKVNAYCKAQKASLTDVAGSTRLSIANSAWIDQRKVTLDEGYRQRVEHELDAQVFAAELNTEAAMKAINEWVSANTQGLIPTMLSRPLGDDAAAALFNTVYFKGKWERPFKAGDTFDRAFHKTDGSSVEAPFMNGSGWNDYISTESVEGVVLPYDDGKTALLALRPKNGADAREFAAALTAGQLAEYIKSAESTDIYFHMPKFTVTFEITLNDALRAMGMETLFDARAELAGLGVPVAAPLYVSTVFQKVKVIVDEEGTEAAAATGMVMFASAVASEEKPTLDLDSPFMYAVMDLDSGMPLFIGVLDDPAE